MRDYEDHCMTTRDQERVHDYEDRVHDYEKPSALPLCYCDRITPIVRTCRAASASIVQCLPQQLWHGSAEDALEWSPACSRSLDILCQPRV